MTEDDAPPITAEPSAPEASTPEASAPGLTAADKTSERELRCGAVRYGVICTLPERHDGMHRHDPGDDRTQLSWLHEP